MQCNIDDKGARVRKTWGIMNIFVALILGGLAFWTGIWWLWLIMAAMLLAGSFAIYESRKKWCALRAMGIKTSI